MEFVWYAVAAGLGLVLGGAFVAIRAQNSKRQEVEKNLRLFQENMGLSERAKSLEFDRNRLQEKCTLSERELLDLNRRLSTAEAKLGNSMVRESELLGEKNQLTRLIDEQRARLLDLSQKLSSTQSSQSHLEERLKGQNQFMDEFRKQTKTEFENLAQQVLEGKSKIFSEQTEKNLEAILNPLKERILIFEKKVDDSYSSEAKERHALKSEVERLIQLNDRMTKETNQLTQALKGDSKFQGDWGELVLERILESSGLREGHEYFLQREHEDHDGGKFKPDAVIHLPEAKHIVIDSKVSLKAYELFCRMEDPLVKQANLLSHLKSIHKHIDELSEKHYSKLKGINSPEFVFLFMPIEPAYLLAMENDSDLSMRAWKKNVAIVTASTLFTSLKTVASIWRLENQNKNALEIAKEGAKLYDKFVGFLDDFERVGKSFETGQAHYHVAMNKLKDGPGNVFRKMELLRELGAAPNKQIRAEYLE